MTGRYEFKIQIPLETKGEKQSGFSIYKKLQATANIVIRGKTKASAKVLEVVPLTETGRDTLKMTRILQLERDTVVQFKATVHADTSYCAQFSYVQGRLIGST